MSSQPDKEQFAVLVSSGLVWALLLVVLMSALQALPEGWREALRYERMAVLDGQAWRLLTAGFVHLGWAHLALNGLALLLIAWIFAGGRTGFGWTLDLVFCDVACHVGLLLFSPDVFWVVGLSGALHGLFVVGALTWIAASVRAGWALLAGVLLKVGWEQFSGDIPLTGEIVGGAVVVDAHLWGLIGGFAAFAVTAAWRQGAARL